MPRAGGEYTEGEGCPPGHHVVGHCGFLHQYVGIEGSFKPPRMPVHPGGFLSLFSRGHRCGHCPDKAVLRNSGLSPPSTPRWYSRFPGDPVGLLHLRVGKPVRPLRQPPHRCEGEGWHLSGPGGRLAEAHPIQQDMLGELHDQFTRSEETGLLIYVLTRVCKHVLDSTWLSDNPCFLRRGPWNQMSV